MSTQNTTKKSSGMNVGSATLVMLFSVLCLTIFAVLSVVTAGNAWTLAEKSSDAVTAYYVADLQAIEIYDEITANYEGAFTLPTTCVGGIIQIDGEERLNYWIAIDDNQQLWVQLYDQDGTPQVARWEVQANGTWEADQSIQVWGG